MAALAVDVRATVEKVRAAGRVFAEYHDPAVLYSTHYRLWISACDVPPEKMTRADVRRLEGDGWKWDKKLESWTLQEVRR